MKTLFRNLRMIVSVTVLLGFLAVCSYADAQPQAVQQQITTGINGVVGAIQRQQMLNASAMLLYGEEGRDADGYVVARGIDGYYSVWNYQQNNWQIMEPSCSTILEIILYDARACVVHRWLKSKWCIVDLEGYPDKKKYAKNKVLLKYKYDAMKCVARNAPIAVGKKKGKKMIWGLMTRDPESGAWSHSVEDNWEQMDLYRFEDIFYARALKQGYATLYALDGSVIAEGPYDDLNVFDGVIEAKQNGQWTKLNQLEILPNYRRIEKAKEEEPAFDPLVPRRD